MNYFWKNLLYRSAIKCPCCPSRKKKCAMPLEYEIASHQNRALGGEDEVVDCLTLDEFRENDFVFRNKFGSHYSADSLRSYFGEVAVKMDPMQRVEYRNPFVCEAPGPKHLTLTEQLMVSWVRLSWLWNLKILWIRFLLQAPDKTPITFSAKILQTKHDAWSSYVRSKLMRFISHIRRSPSEDYDYKIKQLIVFCDDFRWLDVKLELENYSTRTKKVAIPVHFLA